uniref:LOW QUALITY PROTEIN: protein fuzzy homolog n=1 Tax=Petromyzon marinus TaxID=7757 RepID=A0AAJ7XHW9_PETMA|nr:LOW QUALITY PROTEIN: protein fuzzy homolog [Petromyzon marinus]
MAAQHLLLCLTASGGVPLFTRTQGHVKQLPFSVIGSLNGVHMFGSNQGALLSSTALDDGTLTWRVFHDSITLILVTTGGERGGEAFLHRLLENVFGALVLMIGLDELVNIRNVERLKRDLKACYQLVDSLLGTSELAVELTGSPDCLLCPDNDILRECLEAFTAGVDSAFGCLLARGRVCVATERWWQLAPQEGSCWGASERLPPASSRDVPVYLPHAAPPQVPHRLLTFRLLPGLELCVLCGPQPTLQDIQSTQLVERFWRPVLEPLRTCVVLAPHAFHSTTPLHGAILGLLLVNTELKRSLFTVAAASGRGRWGRECGVDGGRRIPMERRRSILKAFYRLAVTNYFSQGATRVTGSEAVPLVEDFQRGFAHSATECYVSADGHRCYGLQAPPRQLFLLLGDVPTLALRPISRATLQALTKLL